MNNQERNGKRRGERGEGGRRGDAQSRLPQWYLGRVDLLGLKKRSANKSLIVNVRRYSSLVCSYQIILHPLVQGLPMQ